MNSTIRSAQHTLRMLCIPHAGGSSTFFMNWQTALPSLSVYPLPLPGREARYSEPLVKNLQAMVELLWQENRSFFLTPYVLFGHSMGARLAYELAKKAATNNYPEPQCLIVSGACAPQYLKDVDSYRHNLPQENLIAKLSETGGTPDAILTDEKLMNIYLPCIRADYELIERAPADRDENVLSCPIFAYGGDSDTGVPLEKLQAWRKKTSNNTVVRSFSGGHFYLTDKNNAVLTSINSDLASVL